MLTPDDSSLPFFGAEDRPQHAPLAQRMRPKTIDDVVGQAHLLGPGMPLRILIEAKKLHSLILWGPPGVGKTTLAQVLAEASQAHLLFLSAVMAGVKEIRAAVAQAQAAQAQGRQTVLFIDEIHRFNKSQQDALLPFVESGLLTFIGATTENPSFEVNSALLSRSLVYVLRPLEDADFRALFLRAQQLEGNGLDFDESAYQSLCSHADGDARRFLNLLEWVFQCARDQELSQVNTETLERLAPSMLRRFDKGGDAFYDQISALHKSVRGSDPDAALYWFCRMIDGGADPKYLARRIIRMAWEDIGLADPRALDIAQQAALAYDRLGSPEGELPLAQAVVFLSVAAKSNASYMAFKAATAHVRSTGSLPVPMHLRNAPTKLMKQLGHGDGYQYAHDEPDAHVAGENYWPDSITPQAYYQPSDRGLEAKISEKMAWLAERNHGKTAKKSPRG